MSLDILLAVLVSISCAVIVVWCDLRWGAHGYSLFVLTFFAAAFIGRWCRAVKNKEKSSFELALERLDEKANILANEIETKKTGIASLEEKLKKYSTLKEAIEVLSTHLSIDEIARLIIEQALKTLGKPGRALLFLVDTERQSLMLSASWGDLRIMTKTGDIYDHWVLRHRQSLIVEDISKDFRFPADGPKKTHGSFRSLIAAPLINEDKVVGILRMDSPDELAYTQDDLRLLDIIADLGALTVENALLYVKTEELAIKDSLTGLFVRRYFAERFHEELQRGAITKSGLSLLILDIDHFKDYNDQYGHAAGDLVLKYLSKTINSLVREGDIVARYGGEEMVVLLAGRGKKDAISAAENIRKTIKDKPLSFRRHVANITISIGLASYPEDSVIEEELIRLADKRLYKAKKAGRDRVSSS